MITPVYKNIEFHDELFIERCLPSKGKILVNEGEEVFSYTKLGYSKDSSKEIIIPRNLKINPQIKNKKFIKSGELLANKGTQYLFAPFDGYLETREGVKVLIKHLEDYWLLSGIGGKIHKVIPSRSCLIRSKGYTFKFVETSIPFVEGELRVLPNPSELIEIDFMEKYIKNGVDQIVYTGDYLRKSLLIKAIEIGCEGIICGSCDRETLLFAKQNNFFVGILSGFGRIPTHSKTYSLFKKFDKKYALVRDQSKEMFVSSELLGNEDLKLINIPYTFLKKGSEVVCLNYPYFGWEAEVLKVESDRVDVKISKNNEVLSLLASDLIALA